MAAAVEYSLPSFVSKHTLIALRSATRYSCRLQASTLKGFGPSAVVVVWTEPDGIKMLFITHRYCYVDHDCVFAFKKLNWLPLEQRIQFKLSLLVHKALIGHVPTYLSDLLTH